MKLGHIMRRQGGWTAIGSWLADYGATAAAGVGAAATLYSATNQPSAPKIPAPPPNTQTNVAAVDQARATDRRRALMGGGIASTILSQTGTPTGGGKALLGS